MKLFIMERNGDHNYEAWSTEEVLLSNLARIREQGGYWTTDREKQKVFVPWHQVEFARLEQDED